MKHEKILSAAKDKGYGIEDLKQLLEEIDSGEKNVDELYEEILKSVNKKLGM